MNETDSKYMDEMFKEYENEIKYTVSRTLKNNCTEDIEDCTMDVFWVACLKIDELKASPNPPGWLVNTAKYVSMNYLRKNGTIYRHGVEENDYFMYTESSFENELLEEITYEAWIEDNATSRILSMLNKSERKMYYYKYRRRLTAEEISKKEKKSIGSIRVAISRMESKVRRIILRREFEKK